MEKKNQLCFFIHWNKVCKEREKLTNWGLFISLDYYDDNTIIAYYIC